MAIVALMVVSTGRAQSVQFSGYVEHQAYPQDLGGRFIVMDYSKARLDLNIEAFDWLRLSGDAVGQAQHGRTRFNSFDFIPTSVVEVYARGVGQSVADLSRDFEFRIDHELYIDNAFVSMYAGNVSIRAGRQQLSWGPGYAWNPSDIFQDKNVLDPTYEKRGADAVSISIPTSSLGRITGVIGIEKDWNRAKKAIRWRTHLSGFDVTFLAMETHEQFIDYDDFHETTSRRRMIGGDFSGTLGEFGVWMESTWSDVDDGPDYLQALVGIDHTTESGLYLLAEYYHNGKGKKERSLYDFNAWMSLISSTGDHLGRDYLFVGQSYPLSDLLTGSVFTIVGVTDASAVLYPNLEYSLSDNAVLTAIGYATAGKGDSEFGSFGWGTIVRARLYF